MNQAGQGRKTTTGRVRRERLPTLAVTLFLTALVFHQLQSPAQAHAQPVIGEGAAPPRAPRHQLSLEVTPLAGAIAYAARIAANTSAGIGVGGGFDLATLVPLAGRHFASDGGLSYEGRDGATGKHFTELLQMALFIRHFLPRGWMVETGLRAAEALHSDSSDDDSGGATFAGAYGAVFWGGSILSIGARLSAGSLHEEFGAATREFGVLVHPIIVKLTTR